METGPSLSNFRFLPRIIGLSSFPSFGALLANLWLKIIVVGYFLSVLGLIAIVYITMELFELRRREHVYYHTLITPPQAANASNARWGHIESLVNDPNPSQWREAIIEADIMLDEALGNRGYVGNGVGEKLKTIDQEHLRTLQDAWDVHKVRNQIAHQGSAFDLSDTLAQRTISRYESVLRELNAI
jgi:hypothetical protein